MAYPWYSTGKRRVGKNGLVAITIEENCETKETRYKADIIDQFDHNTRLGKKTISSKTMDDLHTKVNKYISKVKTNLPGRLDDIAELFEGKENTTHIVKEVKHIEKPKKEAVKRTNTKSELFKIRTTTGTQEIEGKRVNLLNGIDLFIHKHLNTKEWAITEVSTGLQVAKGKTQKEAKESFLYRVEKRGEETVINKIKELAENLEKLA